MQQSSELHLTCVLFFPTFKALNDCYGKVERWLPLIDVTLDGG
jgi:hypothetical protein